MANQIKYWAYLWYFKWFYCLAANISAVLWSCSQFTVLYSNSRRHFVCLDGSLFIFMPSVISLWGFQNDLSSGHRINLLKRELGVYYCLNAYLVHVKNSFIWFFSYFWCSYFAFIINIGAKKNHFCKKHRAGNCVDDISSIYLTLFWKYSGARKSGQKMIGQFFGKVLQSFARYRGNFCIILTTLLLDLKTSTQYSIW